MLLAGQTLNIFQSGKRIVCGQLLIIVFTFSGLSGDVGDDGSQDHIYAKTNQPGQIAPVSTQDPTLQRSHAKTA